MADWYIIVFTSGWRVDKYQCTYQACTGSSVKITTIFGFPCAGSPRRIGTMISPNQPNRRTAQVDFQIPFLTIMGLASDRNHIVTREVYRKTSESPFMDDSRNLATPLVPDLEDMGVDVIEFRVCIFEAHLMEHVFRQVHQRFSITDL